MASASAERFTSYAAASGASTIGFPAGLYSQGGSGSGSGSTETIEGTSGYTVKTSSASQSGTRTAYATSGQQSYSRATSFQIDSLTTSTRAATAYKRVTKSTTYPPGDYYRVNTFATFGPTREYLSWGEEGGYQIATSAFTATARTTLGAGTGTSTATTTATANSTWVSSDFTGTYPATRIATTTVPEPCVTTLGTASVPLGMLGRSTVYAATPEEMSLWCASFAGTEQTWASPSVLSLAPSTSREEWRSLAEETVIQPVGSTAAPEWITFNAAVDSEVLFHLTETFVPPVSTTAGTFTPNSTGTSSAPSRETTFGASSSADPRFYQMVARATGTISTTLHRATGSAIAICILGTKSSTFGYNDGLLNPSNIYTSALTVAIDTYINASTDTGSTSGRTAGSTLSYFSWGYRRTAAGCYAPGASAVEAISVATSPRHAPAHMPGAMAAAWTADCGTTLRLPTASLAPGFTCPVPYPSQTYAEGFDWGASSQASETSAFAVKISGAGLSWSSKLGTRSSSGSGALSTAVPASTGYSYTPPTFTGRETALLGPGAYEVFAGAARSSMFLTGYTTSAFAAGTAATVVKKMPSPVAGATETPFLP